MKVLAAFDGSTEAYNAVVQAAAITKKFKGELTVLNVYWDPTEDTYRPIMEGVENISIGDEGSLRILDDVEPMLKETKIKYELRAVRNPNIPKTILNVAEEGGYGCITIGSRGLGRAKAWVLGSVSSRVIADSSCPVVVV